MIVEIHSCNPPQAKPNKPKRAYEILTDKISRELCHFNELDMLEPLYQSWSATRRREVQVPIESVSQVTRPFQPSTNPFLQIVLMRLPSIRTDGAASSTLTDVFQYSGAAVASAGKLAKTASANDGNPMQTLCANDANYCFERLIDLAGAEPGTLAMHGRPADAALSADEYPQAKSLNTIEISPTSRTQERRNG